MCLEIFFFINKILYLIPFKFNKGNTTYLNNEKVIVFSYKYFYDDNDKKYLCEIINGLYSSDFKSNFFDLFDKVLMM